jgi:hypothetical protein
MTGPLGKKWILWGITLTVSVLVLTGPAWGQAPPPRQEEVTAEEEAPPAPPKEEAEKLPPGAPEKPGVFPAAAAPAATTTFEAGPVYGIVAPYGNPAAMDTLVRGWQVHSLAGVRFSPYLEYNGIYRSNIYGTANDRKADFINLVNPGMRMEVPLAAQHRISLGYLGNYFFYSKNDENSHYDHNVNVEGAFNFPVGLSLRLGNTYKRATEEQSATTGHQRPYNRETPYFQGDYRLSDRLKLQGIYQLDDLMFVDSRDQSDNYREQLGGAALYYRFWPKTAAFVQYMITAREYPYTPQANNKAQSPFVGLTWDPTAKLSGSIKFGCTFKTYDQDSPTRKKSATDFACSIQTLYRYSRYTQITLTAQRSIQEDIDFGNNAYVNSGVYLAIYHELHYFEATAYIAGSYTNNSYVNAAPDPVTHQSVMRDDNLVTLGGGIVRPFTRWLRLRLDYTYTNRASNAGSLGYNDHRALIGVQSSF